MKLNKCSDNWIFYRVKPPLQRTTLSLLHSPQRARSCRPALRPARAVAAPLLAPRAQSTHRPLHASPASPSAPLNDPALQPCSPLREPDSGSTRTTPRLRARPRSPSREPGPASAWPSQATVSSLDLRPQSQTHFINVPKSYLQCGTQRQSWREATVSHFQWAQESNGFFGLRN